jgi:hypothetical protein
MDSRGMIMGIGAFLLVVAILWPTTLPLARTAGTPVDLEIILAVDVSRSLDIDEYKLQREGYGMEPEMPIALLPRQGDGSNRRRNSLVRNSGDCTARS